MDPHAAERSREEMMPSLPGKAPSEPRILFCIQRFPPAFGGGAQFLRLVRDAIAVEGIESIGG